MNFDEVIDRRNTHSSKWDNMEKSYGVSPDTGIAMWVADMDFRAPDCVLEAVDRFNRHGIYGYYGDDAAYRAAICWWAHTRHGWTIEPSWIFTTHGLVNGVAMCIDSYTAPGDGVVLFTPVYHAFARVISAAGRHVVSCPMEVENGRHRMDTKCCGEMLDGSEKMLILCSPHNPGGQVWSAEELRDIADFARRHDLILVCDEIHCDLIYPGHTHTTMALADPSITDRLVVLSAPSKTFNIAGAHTGHVIIPDPSLRKTFGARMAAMGQSPNAFGLHMTVAAYSPEGAAWLEALMVYLDGNRRLFDTAINALPGLSSMPLEATYLAWVDFSGTGMSDAEIIARIQTTARIAASHGSSFGPGGEAHMRFNLAAPRSVIQDAIIRLQEAFGDLQ